MPAPSLLELARKECIKNIQNINHVGTLEYEIVRPLLLKLTNPEQLVCRTIIPVLPSYLITTYREISSSIRPKSVGMTKNSGWDLSSGTPLAGK